MTKPTALKEDRF